MAELIVYLEPDQSVRDKVDTFVQSTKKRFNATTATKYSCHVTMTGFFQVRDSAVEIPSITRTLDTLLERKVLPRPTIDYNPVLVKGTKETRLGRTFIDIPVHLLLPVNAPEAYRELVREFAAQVEGVRPKSINHISLAYWDEPNATDEEEQAWYRGVSQEHLMEDICEDAKHTFCGPQQPTPWDIVLYQRIVKGEHVGEPHQFKEIRRWRAVC